MTSMLLVACGVSSHRPGDGKKKRRLSEATGGALKFIHI